MSHSYSSNRIHLIFSTKNREKRISEELQTRLWPYMAGIAGNHGFEAIKVGGVDDHAHALLLLPPVLPLGQGSSGLEIMLFKMDQRYKSCG
jgi:REP-associated tyrosine transposase